MTNFFTAECKRLYDNYEFTPGMFAHKLQTEALYTNTS